MSVTSALTACGPGLSTCIVDRECQSGSTCREGLCIVNPQSKTRDGGAGGGTDELNPFDGGSGLGGGFGTGGGGDAIVNEDGGAVSMPDAGESDAGVCIPKTCEVVSGTCGTFSDGCGGALNCNGCGPLSRCENQRCVCNSNVDEPDDEFLDTNCDGVDGDARKGIFVSAEGDDNGDGTRASPVKTFQRVLALWTVGRTNVFVSEGTYEVSATALPSGIRVFGGYRKTNWKRDDDALTVLTTAPSGMLLERCTEQTVLDRVLVRSTPVPFPYSASHALRIVDCGTSVTLNHVELVAVDGTDGINGQQGAAGADGMPGKSGESVQGSMQRAVGGDAVPKGGAGGIGLKTAAADDTNSGLAGQNNFARVSAAGNSSCDVPGNGEHAAAGASGGNGFNGGNESSAFTLDEKSIWLVTGGSGTRGADGQSGQGGNGGGGGGAFLICSTGAVYEGATGGYGGGGGSGGTGGTGGYGGSPGGSSIALVVVKSQPILRSVKIVTGRGGNGGRGGLGGAGGRGGTGGTGAPQQWWYYNHSGSGGSGGSGGNGGNGGRGGDGVGGYSVGIVCSEATAAINLAHVTFVLGAPGKGGADGKTDGLQAQTWHCP